MISYLYKCPKCETKTTIEQSIHDELKKTIRCECGAKASYVFEGSPMVRFNWNDPHK